jgi:hypothetical protein
MSAVSGGTGGVPSVGGLSGIANVNVSVNQNLIQLQYISIAALNDVGMIGLTACSSEGPAASLLPPAHIRQAGRQEISYTYSATRPQHT